MSAVPKAMVLAAGFGTRMRPLTDTLPKPLIPVAGKTMLDRALDLLADAGVKEAVVNSHYLADKLEVHVATRTRPAIRISRENDILETGGGIYNALPLLGDAPFFCVNSDVILLDGATPALHRLLAQWDEAATDALLLLQPVDKAVGYDGHGDFFLSENGRLRRRLDAPRAPFVFTGIQLLHPRLFHHAPGGAFSLNMLYNRGIAGDGTLSPRIRGLIHDGKWLHVGDAQGLKQAEAALA